VAGWAERERLVDAASRYSPLGSVIDSDGSPPPPPPPANKRRAGGGEDDEDGGGDKVAPRAARAGEEERLTPEEMHDVMSRAALVLVPTSWQYFPPAAAGNAGRSGAEAGAAPRPVGWMGLLYAALEAGAVPVVDDGQALVDEVRADASAVSLWQPHSIPVPNQVRRRTAGKARAVEAGI
jgi:hypothetical protein